MIYVLIYLAVGFMLVLDGAHRGIYDISKRTVTYLQSGGKPPVTKETRNLTEVAFTILSALLLWPCFFLFFLYTLWHDWRAESEWKKNPPPWLTDKP